MARRRHASPTRSRQLLQLAGELIGEDCFELAGQSTRYAQPAIFLSSLAAFLELEDPVAAVAFAGHSLGELSALAAAGALRWEDALELVVLRGALMDESGNANGGDGSMLALLEEHAGGGGGCRRGRRGLGRQRQRPRADRARRPARGAARGCPDRARARRALTRP